MFNDRFLVGDDKDRIRSKYASNRIFAKNYAIISVG